MPGRLESYISADSHIYEPDDMWTTRVDKRFRDRAPHTETIENVDYFCVDGVPPTPVVGFLGASIKDKMKGEGAVTSPVGRTADVRPGGWDPQARLADQDLDHVRAEVLYAGVGIFVFSATDAEYQRECVRVYNDWLAEFCAAAPQRLIGIGLLPLRGPMEWAIAEAERVARMGMKGFMIPCDVKFHDPRYQPLWAALQDMNLPIAVHPGAALNYPFVEFEDIPNNTWIIQVKLYPMMRSLSMLLGSAILQRYPRLRFVVVEGGIGWMASAVRLMDHWWEDHRQWIQPKLDEKPSHYFQRQVWATFEDDRAGMETRHLLNVDHLMWGSDYPHTEGTFPRSQQQIAHDFVDVPDHELRKIAWDNAAQLYGIDVA